MAGQLWDLLYETVAETEPDTPERSPAQIRESLQQAGWTDDTIWQALLDLCSKEMKEQTKKIKDLQKQKQDHKLALQVRKKMGCIPDTKDLDRLLKYEGAIERQFYRALNELERLQRLRRGVAVPAPVSLNVALHTEETA